MSIDGKNNRFNYWDSEVNDSQRKISQGIGILIPRSSLRINKNNTCQIKTINYGDNCSLCCKDPFYYEPVIYQAAGTCFALNLNNSTVIVTAKHVVEVAMELGYVRSENEFIENYCVAFGFIAGVSTNEFPLSQIYLLSKLNRKDATSHDVIFFKSDRSLPCSLEFNNSNSEMNSHGIYAVGHPLKMQIKFTLNGVCNDRVNEEKSVLSLSCDSFMFNSGSPVFTADNKLLGMIISNYTGPDFFQSTCQTCNKNINEYYTVPLHTSQVKILVQHAIRESSNNLITFKS